MHQCDKAHLRASGHRLALTLAGSAAMLLALPSAAQQAAEIAPTATTATTAGAGAGMTPPQATGAPPVAQPTAGFATPGAPAVAAQPGTAAVPTTPTIPTTPTLPTFPTAPASPATAAPAPNQAAGAVPPPAPAPTAVAPSMPPVPVPPSPRSPFAAAPRASTPLPPSLPSPPVKGLPAGTPSLVINGATYSADPRLRLLIVNNQVVREGANLGGGVQLRQIGPEAAVLAIRGADYTVRY